MSNIVHDTHVMIFLADYASPDSAGKVNVIGGGITMVGAAAPGVSLPFAVIVEVSVPNKYVGREYALTVELHDVTVGALVQVPNESGQFQPLRAQQVVTVAPYQAPPGVQRPHDVMLDHRMVMNFVNGLPLPEGHSFEVRVQIDSEKRKDWFRRFHTLGAAPGVVFGGPDGPANIPGVGEYIDVDDEDEKS